MTSRVNGDNALVVELIDVFPFPFVVLIVPSFLEVVRDRERDREQEDDLLGAGDSSLLRLRGLLLADDAVILIVLLRG